MARWNSDDLVRDIVEWLEPLYQAFADRKIKDVSIAGLRRQFGLSYNRAAIANALFQGRKTSRVLGTHLRAWDVVQGKIQAPAPVVPSSGSEAPPKKGEYWKPSFSQDDTGANVTMSGFGDLPFGNIPGSPESPYEPTFAGVEYENPDIDTNVDVEADGGEGEAIKQAMGDPERLGGVLNQSTDSRVTNPEQMCRVAGVDLDKWRITRARVNRWPTTMKGPDKLPIVVVNWQVRLDLEPIASALLRIPEMLGATIPAPAPGIDADLETVVFLGDPQVGFVWSKRHRDLVPLHDRMAMDLALQVCERLQPDHIVLPGDFFDFAELSMRFPRAPDAWDTTQASLIVGTWWIQQFRLACPNSRIYFIEGNHEERLTRLLRDRAPVLETLEDVRTGESAFSIAKLMHLDDLHVEYVGPYPNGEVYFFDGRLRASHGTVVKAKPGHTSSAVVQATETNEVFGHIHRMERSSRTIHGYDGIRTITAFSPGCLCRVDGAVPGVSAKPSWQQGVSISTYHRESGYVGHELIHIENGLTILHGELLEARNRKEEIMADTGLRLAD